MSLVPLALLVVVAFGGIVAALVAVFATALVRALEVVEPAQRARWLLALLAAPWVAGLVTITAAWVPCLFEPHGVTAQQAEEICRFCLFHPARVTGLVWTFGLLAAIPFVRASIVGSRGVRATRRLVHSLQPIARYDAETGVHRIPGTHSFAAGWPRAEAWVGEALDVSLSPTALDAVVAHERAHVNRRDVNTRVLARILGAGHVPFASHRLVEALDLAIEQACDAEASQFVRDPLVVADALVAVSRLAEPTLRLTPGFAENAIETRIAALCDARWAPRARTAMLAMALAVVVSGAGIAFSAQLHHAAEAWVALITR